MALRCTGCGYDNDPTRVYCHSCGARLERGAAASAPTGFMHPTDIARMKKPRRHMAWGQYFVVLLKVAVLVLLLAAVALALLPPRELPSPVAPDEALAVRLNSLLEDASSSPDARSFGLPAGDVNRWLVSSVQLLSSEGLVKIRPERLYAIPGEGQVRVGLEVALPGAGHVFFEGNYAPVRESGGYALQPRRYSIGRLPVPVLLGWPVQKQLDGLAAALNQPLGQLSRASHIGIDPDMVTLRWSDPAK